MILNLQRFIAKYYSGCFSAIIGNDAKAHECSFCTKISKVRRFHVARLLLEDGGATAGKGVHVGRDGADGHVARPSSFLDGMVVPQSWRLRAGWSCEHKMKERKQNLVKRRKRI